MSAELKSEQLRQLVGKKIFTVEFTKKDGSLRVMNCMLGVTKHLKGGEMKHDPEELNHIVVFDMQKKAYRTINLNTLERITFEGKTITFED
jgi:hypothetical protein